MAKETTAATLLKADLNRKGFTHAQLAELTDGKKGTFRNGPGSAHQFSTWRLMPVLGVMAPAM